MKVMIVDDERLAREELKRLLLPHSQLKIVGEASNILEAAEKLRQQSPDLIFLDVQMPGGSGFDLMNSIDVSTQVIFTTAYDQYALRAFDVSAIDYLLKPIEEDRLDRAIQKALRHFKPEADSLAISDAKVFIKDGDQCWYVALEHIVLFESEGNYTRVYFDQQRPLMLRSLNQLEAKLDPAQFLRTSRRQIVNLNFVDSISSGTAGSMTLTLKGNLKVSMSRRRAAEFRHLNRL